MSDIIRLLPDSVANQIAAGEVIQRPSSVIKELVENSIDAGATKVQIVVLEAGKDSIQVVDNGKGMSDTDARVAFERHATSKITEAADLFSLQTMGFRGEALASIAAVAQVELRTRLQGEEIGTSLIIEGSRVKEQQPVTCPVGANFIVRNLFFNIPARRKFLKSNQTELNNILTEFERIALAHPEVEFSLYSGETLLQNLPIGNFKQRILNIFGRKVDARLVPLQVKTELVQISGFVGTPQGARKKGFQQYFFVNGRFMRHPYFNKAVQTAYERLVPDGEQVSYFINFTIDPSHIDVNIHPQKTEIKFQDEQAIWPILLAAVREALGKFSAVPTLDFDTAGRPNIPAFTGQFEHIRQPEIHVDRNFNPFAQPSEGGAQDGKAAVGPFGAGGNKPVADFAAAGPLPASGESSRSSHHATSAAVPKGWDRLYDELTASGASQEQSESDLPDTTLYAALPGEEHAEWARTEADCLQFMGRFIVTPAAAGLLLVDQHRAHFRVLYEVYMQRLARRKGITQGLLFPQLLQLSPSAAGVLELLLPELTGIGFDLSPLGGGAYSILGIPAGTEGLDPVDLLQTMIDDAAQGQVEVREQIHHEIACSLARRSAIPVGQALSAAEMNNLLRELAATENSNFTPDGQPVSFTIPTENILKMLG